MTVASDRPIRVRIAPSPTGPLHFGTARTALFNWLFARANNGTFIVRIEDTDKERSEKKYEEEILNGFGWLGLDWDEGPAFTGAEKALLIGEHDRGKFGPYRQSERLEIYKKYLQQLLNEGHAYYCYCTKEDLEAQRQGMLSAGLAPKYNGHCRNLKEPPENKEPEVIRFKIAEVKVDFKDLVRGKVTFDATLLGDQVIAKDLDTPLYNFAVVVDDELMEISHVIRGEDHLSNTPKQILLQRALGFKEPIYAHIPLILNSDRSKMSKRMSDVALLSYREKGYLPQAMVNFMALLGWHPSGDREVFTATELIEAFTMTRVQQSGAIFNEEKLLWLNKEHIKKMDDKGIVELLLPLIKKEIGDAPLPSHDFLEKIVSVGRTRASTLMDFIIQGKFFFNLPDYEAKLLIWKNAPFSEVLSTLKELYRALKEIPDDEFHKEHVNEVVAAIISQQNAGSGNRGTVLWPLRVALSGQSASPDPLDIMEVLGKDASLARIEVATTKLEHAS